MSTTKFRHDILIGDCMMVMKQLEDNSFDALITDPPYGSGGLHASSRTKPPTEKYCTAGTGTEYSKHEYDGDSMDQRAWIDWTVEWLKLSRRVVKPGGVAASFIDWRQLGALEMAMQQAGWTVRGIIPWDKVIARPQKGRPTQQCEFIVWASNGSLNRNRNAPIMPGIFTHKPVHPSKRMHQAEKPIELMQEVVLICEKGGSVIDPFAGHGTTVCAAKHQGFGALGIESNLYHGNLARERLNDI